jgi:hypothetical protein
MSKLFTSSRVPHGSLRRRRVGRCARPVPGPPGGHGRRHGGHRALGLDGSGDRLMKMTPHMGAGQPRAPRHPAVPVISMTRITSGRPRGFSGIARTIATALRSLASSRSRRWTGARARVIPISIRFLTLCIRTGGSSVTPRSGRWFRMWRALRRGMAWPKSPREARGARVLLGLRREEGRSGEAGEVEQERADDCVCEIAEVKRIGDMEFHRN